jgi:type II secretory pathway component PulC
MGNDSAATKKPDETGKLVTRIEIAPAAGVHKNIASTAKAGNEQQRQENPPKLPRLDYTVLRLQAVTWAVDPQDRFALVDNTILRKGESVKGFVIDSIHEEHVVVRKGSEKWRLEFRLR